MARIAVGGWQHETNTFATIKAGYSAFECADEWPQLASGAQMLEAVSGVHLPVTGALSVIEKTDHEIIPLLWCSATPSAHVTESAFETIASRMVQLIEKAMPLDGIYLDLHGAMVCEHCEDGEGEILRRIRSLVGADLPIAVSLDLHANVTPLMVEHASVLDIFRTYPHIDMGETGARTMHSLLDMIENNARYFSAFKQIDFLIPLNFGCSLMEPCQSIYESIPERITEGVLSLSFACGFHLSDIYDVGPSVVAYASSKTQAEETLLSLTALIESKKDHFFDRIWPEKEALLEADKLSKGGTVVLADTQDNPGGGGSGDTTGLLQAMLEERCRNALFGAVSDSSVARQSHEAGVGATIDINLGGKSGLPNQQPYACSAKVLALSDGSLTATGPMYKGARMQLGPCVLLDIQGVHVLVSSKAVQTADQAIFTHIGINPEDYAIVAIKSSVHFRNHFSELATAILVVASPGVVHADPATLSYNHSRPQLKLS